MQINRIPQQKPAESMLPLEYGLILHDQNHLTQLISLSPALAANRPFGPMTCRPVPTI